MFKTILLIGFSYLSLFAEAEVSLINNNENPDEFVQKTNLQSLMSTPLFTNVNADIIKYFKDNYNIVRLWPLDTPENIFRGNNIIGEYGLETKNYRVKPVYCSSKHFAYFQGQAMIEVDETPLISEALSELKMTSKDNNIQKLSRIYKKVKEHYSNILSYNLPDSFSNSKNESENSEIFEKHKNIINESSSLVEVKKNDQGQSFLNASDYTVGGWFKPDSLTNQNSMILLSKYYKDKNHTQETPEWKVFYSGNVVYFQSFQDGFSDTQSRYLGEADAAIFRNQNSQYYQYSDYYDDVVSKKINSNIAMNKKDLLKLIPTYTVPHILPTEKGNVHKPVIPMPAPSIPRIVQPTVNPSLIVIPPGDIPVAVPPSGVIIGGLDQVVKDHILDIDLKHFWWSSSLGQCFGCVQAGVKSDVWHYMAVSVHLNDPLGPYLDFWIIQDPNAKLFGSKATIQNNIRHLRLELNRKSHSFPVINPFVNSDDMRKNCDGDDCIHSVLEMGSISQNSGYSGYMRGVYLSKKAMKENEILNLAAQYYPDDSLGGCTYGDNSK